MIDQEDHPEMAKAQAELLRRIGIVLGPFGKPLDRSLIEKLFSVIKDHREEYRKKGVDFTVLAAITVPGTHLVHFCRADLDLPSIRVQIVNFVQMNPGVSMTGVVAAFRRAFPDLKPDDVLNEDQRARKMVERRLDRAVRAAREVGLTTETDDETRN